MKKGTFAKTLKELQLKNELTQEQLARLSNSIAFGKALKGLRLKSGLTQEQLAELADINYKYLQKLEGKNPSSPTLNTLNSLAIGLNISISDLLGAIKNIDTDL